jgi:hypothetical protein
MGRSGHAQAGNAAQRPATDSAARAMVLHDKNIFFVSRLLVWSGQAAI